MVVVGGGEAVVREKEFVMTTGSERSRTLHNFSLSCLKWGRQKQLRCVKVSDDVDQVSSPSRRSPPSRMPHPARGDSGGIARMEIESDRKRKSFHESPAVTEIRRRSLIGAEDDDNGIEAVRAKLMMDFQTEVDKMKVAILSNGGIGEEIDRPWSLRTRRGAVRKETDVNDGVGGGVWKADSPPSKNENELPRLRSENGNAGDKNPRAKFSVPLSKREIEEDFMAMAGIRPPRRPKKRPRNIRKQMDTIFPGLWLSEITADMYKVNENPDTGKR